jgi:cystathionine gamma-lyase
MRGDDRHAFATRAVHGSGEPLVIAEALCRHPSVRRVIYLGLPPGPQHELARHQMNGFGGMVTVELATDLAGCRRVLERVRLFTLAESLAGRTV